MNIQHRPAIEEWAADTNGQMEKNSFVFTHMRDTTVYIYIYIYIDIYIYIYTERERERERER